jgi:hypothetical protein
MSGIIKYMIGKLSKNADVAAALSQDKIAACNPEEDQETKAEEKEEHKAGREVKGK